MKIVFDTNVILSALITQGLSSRILDICIDKHEIFISPWILKEVIEKLDKKFKVKNSEISKVEIFLRNVCKVIYPTAELPNVCRDKDDNNILQLADFVSADLIITGDNDLLILKKYKEAKIINPREFMRNYNDLIH